MILKDGFFLTKYEKIFTISSNSFTVSKTSANEISCKYVVDQKMFWCANVYVHKYSLPNR